jgi:hypothetical protein
MDSILNGKCLIMPSVIRIFLSIMRFTRAFLVPGHCIPHPGHDHPVLLHHARTCSLFVHTLFNSWSFRRTGPALFSRE